MQSTIKITLALLLFFECYVTGVLSSKCHKGKTSNNSIPKGKLAEGKLNATMNGEKKVENDRWNEKTGSKPPDQCPKNEYRPCPWNYEHICWCEHKCDNSWSVCKDAGPYSANQNLRARAGGKAPDPCPKKEYRPCPWDYDHVCWCDHNCDNSWAVCKDAGPWF